jgi:hypothetical protein
MLSPDLSFSGESGENSELASNDEERDQS